MSVILPHSSSRSRDGESTTNPANHPVLYLLHGAGGNHSVWNQKTSIERYASRHGLVVVMPEVPRSFYVNQMYGNAYWDFISEELSALCLLLLC